MAESTTGKARSMGLIERNAISTNDGVRHRTDIDTSSFAGEITREGQTT
jgi:hypothetical protein